MAKSGDDGRMAKSGDDGRMARSGDKHAAEVPERVPGDSGSCGETGRGQRVLSAMQTDIGVAAQIELCVTDEHAVLRRLPTVRPFPSGYPRIASAAARLGQKRRYPMGAIDLSPQPSLHHDSRVPHDHGTMSDSANEAAPPLSRAAILTCWQHGHNGASAEMPAVEPHNESSVHKRISERTGQCRAVMIDALPYEQCDGHDTNAEQKLPAMAEAKQLSALADAEQPSAMGDAE